MIVSFHLKSDWPLRVLLPEAAAWGDLWKSFFENSAEFKGKHLGQSLFFQKVAGWAHNLIKKRDSSTGVFVLIHNTSWRLLWNYKDELRRIKPIKSLLIRLFCYFYWLHELDQKLFSVFPQIELSTYVRFGRILTTYCSSLLALRTV